MKFNFYIKFLLIAPEKIHQSVLSVAADDLRIKKYISISLIIEIEIIVILKINKISYKYMMKNIF